MTIWLSTYQCDECGGRVKHAWDLTECDMCFTKRCEACRIDASHRFISFVHARTCRPCLERDDNVSDEVQGWAR